ncbi:MAG: FecR domain-containing protein [Alistipes senegalensis]
MRGPARRTLYQTAWKDGFSFFGSKPVGSIMEELSAWYNIDYVLKDSLRDFNITARINVTTASNPCSTSSPRPAA